MITLTSFFAICSVFSKTSKRKMEATSTQTQFAFFKRYSDTASQRPASHWTLRVLLVLTKWTFQRGALAFWFYFQPLFCLTVFIFWRLSNRLLSPLVSGPQAGSHIIKILLASFFFGPYCKLRILVFSHRFMARARKSIEKSSVRNLQYGPKTRLIRGIQLSCPWKVWKRMRCGLKYSGTRIQLKIKITQFPDGFRVNARGFLQPLHKRCKVRWVWCQFC